MENIENWWEVGFSAAINVRVFQKLGFEFSKQYEAENVEYCIMMDFFLKIHVYFKTFTRHQDPH